MFKKAHLKPHVELVHEKNKQFTCEHCNYRCTPKLEYENSYSNGASFKCEIFYNGFTKKQSMARHIASIHEKI